ncbi:MAG: RidA family protein [Gemmatimonadetes bacterium]|nr:RidA family protein [Gemmatimonadota bacterium]
MKDLQVVHTESAPQAIGPYSQAIVAGDLVFASGQIAIDPSTSTVIEGDVAAQTDRVLTNLAAVLQAAGSSLRGVVKTTVYLASMGDFSAMNEVYARHFREHRPARATVAAAGLPKGVSVEIDAIAVRS